MECVICCESEDMSAKYHCAHVICCKCAAKLIFLYGEKACSLCRSTKGKPFFDTTARLSDSSGSSTTKGRIEDDNAVYASVAIQKKVQSLLAKKCGLCKRTFAGNDELIAHYKAEHEKLLCTVCIGNNHQFWFEHTTYTPETLEKHKKGELNELGFTGHVYCTHCKVYFYNKESAKRHCQLEHQLCTICEILGKKMQFYRNYSELQEHYRARHFCCTDSVCVKNLCYAHAYKSELWTHCLTQHSLDLQLADIKLSSRPDPPVCSIGEVEEPDTTGMYRQYPNIVTPLINEPYFPSFTSTTAVPDFMNRQILAQEVQARKSRLQQIHCFTRTFCNEINASIEGYIDGVKDFPTLVKEIESAVDPRVSLKILENISFLQRAKEAKEHLIAYKKQVMFPSFHKTMSPTPTMVKKKATAPFSSYKVLDLSKKR